MADPRRSLTMAVTQKWTVVAALGTAQTLAWASSYYLPAMLAKSMAADIGVSTPTVFMAFSVAMVVSAAVGPAAGRAIDKWGGRPVLLVTNLIFAAGLMALSAVSGPLGLFAAWAILGIGMGSGLYEAAFAALVRLYGTQSRSSITGITLIAGFASTVGWPLSTFMEALFDWRSACVGWAALHLLVGLPLNWSIPGATQEHARTAIQPGSALQPASVPSNQPAQLLQGLLAFVFAATWFTSTAMAAHLPALLQAGGASLAMAVGIGALVGPAQVAARVLEFGLLRRAHPLLSAHLAALAHPVGAIALLAAGTPVAAVFATLHGAGNGVLTIAKGTLPLVLFGPQGYGARQGYIMIQARICQAVAPALFGVWLEWWGVGALWMTSGIGLAAFVALLCVHGQGAVRSQAAT